QHIHSSGRPRLGGDILRGHQSGRQASGLGRRHDSTGRDSLAGRDGRLESTVSLVGNGLGEGGSIGQEERFVSHLGKGAAMPALINHQFRLAARPVGLPKRTDWSYTEEPVREPGDGELLVKILYLSLDPAMRGWMNEGKSYVPPVSIGEIMRAGGAGKVIASRNPRFAVGDHVTGLFGVQEYATTNGKGVNKTDTSFAPLPVYLVGVGMPGMTAYLGLLDVGKPQAGETVVVSGAAGAVGTVVGQIAKIKGCRVFGIAGGPEKCQLLTKDLRFDAAIDYKSENVKES